MKTYIDLEGQIVIRIIPQYLTWRLDDTHFIQMVDHYPYTLLYCLTEEPYAHYLAYGNYERRTISKESLGKDFYKALKNSNDSELTFIPSCAEMLTQYINTIGFVLPRSPPPPEMNKLSHKGYKEFKERFGLW